MKNIDRIREMTSIELAELINKRSCEVCAFQLYEDCEGMNCEEGIFAWLERECELTLDEIEKEADEFCVGECQYCKYKNAHNCRLSFIVDTFNIIDGKIERRKQDV